MKVNEYIMGKTQVSYFISEEGRTSLVIVPNSHKIFMEKQEYKKEEINAGSEYNREWNQGSLVQLHLRHHNRSLGSGSTMKFSESTDLLRFERQYEERSEDTHKIVTVLSASEKYQVVHTLTFKSGEYALYSDTEFMNESDRDMELEMLTSFCLENLSPFQKNSDQTDIVNLHRFRGSWAQEGLHLCESVERLGLQKAWCSPFPKSERFGSVGSWTTHTYFPMAAVEDKMHGVFWAAALEHNASWQMELSRDGDTFSFSGGIADEEKGRWMKIVKPGEHFQAPRAYIAVVAGDIHDACQSLTRLENAAADSFEEKGLPVVFNEYCSSWGNPTQEKVLQYAKVLKGRGIRYFVIDAGWSKDSQEQLGNGEWLVDTGRFPDMKGMNRKLREDGFIPGIWMEFEVTTTGSPVHGEAYGDMHLKRNGVVIHTGAHRTYWDFTDSRVIEYLSVHVIEFLKEYDFGYLKVDYNGNIGLGCDGAESLGEGLRRQMEGVKEFFVKIRQEVPDIIIENCASGGGRTEPSMLAVTTMTSFSDAHEAKEIPYIAANLQNLVLPRQNQIWAVLREQDTVERLEYGIAAGFLGRLCLSGDVEKLSKEQWKTITDGLAFYRELEHVIMEGTTKLYGNRSEYIRHPRGTQAAVRRNEKEMLVVCHGFEDTDQEIVIPLGGEFRPAAYFGRAVFRFEPGFLIVQKMEAWTAGAVYLKV